VDNIFAIEKKSGKIYQVTNGSLGSYQPTFGASEQMLYFSRFTSDGYELRSIAIDPDEWKETKITEPTEMAEYNFVAISEEGGDITKKIPNNKFETQKYPKAYKLVNIHSWSLYFEDPNYEWVLQSNNILNTLNMGLGVRYNRNDDAFTYFFDAEYAQFYPVLTFSASTGKRNILAEIRDQNDQVVDTANISWWESIVRPGITLPFSLNSGLYVRQLNLSGFYSYTNVAYTKSVKEKFDGAEDFSYDSYTTALTFLNRRKKARKNIFAKYSQFLNLSYDRAIDAGKVEQIFADTELTFPGLFANHNLVFQGSFQQEDHQNFPRFGDNFFYARGYNRPIYDMIYKVGTNYHFPVIYPDWGFWGMIYLYRLRANVFFDYSRAHLKISESNFDSIQLYNSTGVEFIIDTRVLNLYDFTFGFRYSVLLNEDFVDPNIKHALEFFIPVMRF
jgi:hypothetical protein